MSWTAGVVDAHGVRIHYRRTGGHKPALVLLHGLTGSGDCWTLLARALESEFDVVMPDARGHGDSDTPSRGYGYEDHAADVRALLQGLGLSDPVLIGHSMGGMTAAVVASQLAQRVRGLVLIDPTFLSPPRQQEVYASDVGDQHRRLLAQDPRAVVADLRARHSHRSMELVNLIAAARQRTRIEAFAVLAPPNPDYREWVRTLAMPILLVGSDGGIVSAATVQELERLNPRLRSDHVAGAGHGIPYDQPDRVAAAVRSFLGSLRGRPADVG